MPPKIAGVPSEIKKEIKLEIGHVLFMDIVGYSKLLIDEQRKLLETLNQIVRNTDAFREADAVDKLIKIPTGDGMALVFRDDPEAPVECALEIFHDVSRRISNNTVTGNRICTISANAK